MSHCNCVLVTVTHCHRDRQKNNKLIHRKQLMATDVFFILSATLNCFIIYVCLEDCKHRVKMSVNSYFVMVLYQCNLIWFLISSLKLITLIQSNQFQTTGSSHSTALHSMLPTFCKVYIVIFFQVELVVFY